MSKKLFTSFFFQCRRPRGRQARIIAASARRVLRHERRFLQFIISDIDISGFTTLELEDLLNKMKLYISNLESFRTSSIRRQVFQLAQQCINSTRCGTEEASVIASDLRGFEPVAAYRVSNGKGVNFGS